MQSIKSFIFVAIVLGGTFLFSQAAQAESAHVAVTYNAPADHIDVGDEQLITWETKNFPEGAFVNINLIKKVSDTPKSYEMVRQIGQYLVNDGEESWKPAKSDQGENLFIEVTCAGSGRFKEGCSAAVPQSEFAVKTDLGNNLALVFVSFWDNLVGFFRN